MPNSISISNLHNNATWKKELTFEEVQAIRNFANGKKTVAIFPAAFMPVRTNNCKNFTNDFFLPTLINQALKIKSIALKIFAFIFDFITFPFRFLFCVPRIIANAVRPENLFLKYLKNEGVEPSLIDADSVRVQFIWESKEQHLKSRWTDKAETSRKNTLLLDIGKNSMLILSKCLTIKTLIFVNLEWPIKKIPFIKSKPRISHGTCKFWNKSLYPSCFY